MKIHQGKVEGLYLSLSTSSLSQTPINFCQKPTKGKTYIEIIVDEPFFDHNIQKLVDHVILFLAFGECINLINLCEFL